MLKVLILSCILLLSSCSHYRTKPDIKDFVSNWTQQFSVQDKRYAKLYEKYLHTVEDIYSRAGEGDEFETYLESLESNSQVLADQEKTLPDLYRQKTGREIASDPEDYKGFIRSQTGLLYNKLYSARELKIQDEVGDALYGKLKENYQQFMKQENAEKFSFPL
jgi:hypothetical protein